MGHSNFTLKYYSSSKACPENPGKTNFSTSQNNSNNDYVVLIEIFYKVFKVY